MLNKQKPISFLTIGSLNANLTMHCGPKHKGNSWFQERVQSFFALYFFLSLATIVLVMAGGGSDAPSSYRLKPPGTTPECSCVFEYAALTSIPIILLPFCK
jgi:hypothetical protein